MALVNAFTVSPCSVSLMNGDTQVYSQTLSLNSSSGNIPGFDTGGSEVVDIVVDVNGLLTLNHVSGSTSNGYLLTVTPPAPFEGGQVQDILLPEMDPNARVISNESGQNLTYSGGSGAVTPDPAIFPSATTSLAVFMGAAI